MSEIEAREKLDLLAEFMAARQAIALEKQALIDTIVTPEIKAKLQEIEEEFKPRFEAMDEIIGKAEKEAKELALQIGESFKGSFLHAVYNKGKVTWNVQGLDGYAIDHPEIRFLREEGKPYIAIKKL